MTYGQVMVSNMNITIVMVLDLIYNCKLGLYSRWDRTENRSYRAIGVAWLL